MDENLIYGKNAVIEAIKAGRNIEKIYLQWSPNAQTYAGILALARKNNISIVQIDKNKFRKLLEDNKLASAKTQGVVAFSSKIELFNLDEFIREAFRKYSKPVVVALDGINDPMNLGAVARVCECSGAFGMIITERGSAPISASAIKASAGALEYIAVSKVGSLTQALLKLKDAGFWIVGTDSNAEMNYVANIYDSPICIVIGGEGSGVSKSVLKHCDYVVKIPLMGKINSLNASVSAGIILYEILRQRNFQYE